jgi:hypothetical protein
MKKLKIKVLMIFCSYTANHMSELICFSQQWPLPGPTGKLVTSSDY